MEKGTPRNKEERPPGLVADQMEVNPEAGDPEGGGAETGASDEDEQPLQDTVSEQAETRGMESNRRKRTKSRRIDELARPKRFASGFERDRRSVYWVDREPPGPGPNGTTKIIATPRVQVLSLHRDPVPQWRGDRLTSIWPVSQSAQHATATERLAFLAQHKDINQNHRMERSPYMTTSPAARSATASGRLEALAMPKDRSDRFQVYQKEWGQTFPVPPPALSAKVTERVEQLAEARKYHKDSQGEKPTQDFHGDNPTQGFQGEKPTQDTQEENPNQGSREESPTRRCRSRRSRTHPCCD